MCDYNATSYIISNTAMWLVGSSNIFRLAKTLHSLWHFYVIKPEEMSQWLNKKGTSGKGPIGTIQFYRFINLTALSHAWWIPEKKVREDTMLSRDGAGQWEQSRQGQGMWCCYQECNAKAGVGASASTSAIRVWSMEEETFCHMKRPPYLALPTEDLQGDSRSWHPAFSLIVISNVWKSWLTRTSPVDLISIGMQAVHLSWMLPGPGQSEIFSAPIERGMWRHYKRHYISRTFCRKGWTKWRQKVGQYWYSWRRKWCGKRMKDDIQSHFTDIWNSGFINTQQNITRMLNSWIFSVLFQWTLDRLELFNIYILVISITVYNKLYFTLLLTLIEGIWDGICQGNERIGVVGASPDGQGYTDPEGGVPE